MNTKGQGYYNGRVVLSPTRAADRAGVSRRTIYVWVGKGLVETVRTASGALRVYEDTLFRQARFEGKVEGTLAGDPPPP